MKVLLIDNYAEDDPFRPRRLARLKEIFGKVLGNEYETQRFENLEGLERYDMYILSGGLHDLSDENVIGKFEKEIELIGTTDKPVLGLCLGHQLIGIAFGFKVRLMEKDELGKVIKLRIKPFELCEKDEIMVEENHKREIKYVPEIEGIFDILASSDDCRVQIIRHKSRKIFGLEFHPDTTKEGLMEDGENFIIRFLESTF